MLAGLSNTRRQHYQQASWGSSHVQDALRAWRKLGHIVWWIWSQRLENFRYDSSKEISLDIKQIAKFEFINNRFYFVFNFIFLFNKIDRFFIFLCYFSNFRSWARLMGGSTNKFETLYRFQLNQSELLRREQFSTMLLCEEYVCRTKGNLFHASFANNRHVSRIS